MIGRSLPPLGLAFGLLAAQLAGPLVVNAQQTPSPGPADPELSGILQRLAFEPTVPQQYSAAVRLHVHLRVFPWISITLHGNEAYKHPGLYHFVFRGVPRAAEHFSDLAYDLGDASNWPDKYTISLLTRPATGIDPVIELLPRKRGMVKTLDVTVDSVKGHIIKAIWKRFDGGTITLLQHYGAVGTREIVSEQDAQIRIPHMSADLVATYTDFAI
ncbi:MAG: hypothetical protein ABI182_06625 [Candidatus Baltobacteraceae bacterium]